ncbi:excalibur calcium-binding domain-containing protein [Cytobacillus depressus]|uniref:Excalibur calcium-binding domain-containing protein n=1 Tax=Cytobacillus depressus TaxID=1602942 RepID=A0A6L3V1K4_9BACI|nr:excalibur calcium-binding domain-containing protein [Cytobacillus depressus]KAB2332076.1 excalibur calcium-binding domain-containing protein [Cytobacillus depressus]
MKKSLTIILCFGLILAIGSSITTEAASSAKTYKNCTELNKDYQGGVAESSSAKNKGGKTKYKPYVSKELYDANKKLDRDKDKIACEK